MRGRNPVQDFISDACLECVTPDRVVCGGEFIRDKLCWDSPLLNYSVSRELTLAWLPYRSYFNRTAVTAISQTWDISRNGGQSLVTSATWVSERKRSVARWLFGNICASWTSVCLANVHSQLRLHFHSVLSRVVSCCKVCTLQRMTIVWNGNPVWAWSTFGWHTSQLSYCYWTELWNYFLHYKNQEKSCLMSVV